MITQGPYLVGTLLYNADAAVMAWAAERIPGMSGRTFGCVGLPATAVGVWQDDRIVGAAVFSFFFDHPEGGDVSVSLVMDPGARVTRGMWRKLYGYPFVQMRCLRISCQTDRNNHVTRKHLVRCGFKLEGVKRCGNGRMDVIHYGLLRSECRFL